MLERFKRDITMRTAGRVEVKLQPMTLSIDDLDVGTEESDSMHIKEEGERQHDWVNRMDDFRLALRGVHDLFREKKLKETDRVKVSHFKYLSLTALLHIYCHILLTRTLATTGRTHR